MPAPVPTSPPPAAGPTLLPPTSPLAAPGPPALRRVGLAARASRSVVDVAGIPVGGEAIVLVAGPCAVEDEAQLFACADAARAAGAQFLRGGAFKPRTSPYDFQGLGAAGLALLAAARARTGLRVVTEVLSTATVDLVARHADVLQVGARNMQNFALLEALGDLRQPVLLKRGLAATVREWLLAAEYIAARGNEQIILCERGIRTFEPETRNTLDLAAVPVVRALCHLPVIVDPSHGSGRRDCIAPLARAAVAVGADGVMIEIHPRPQLARSDGAQSLPLPDFAALAADLRRLGSALGRPLP